MPKQTKIEDVIVPLIIIGALFIINGFVFYYIRLHRKRFDHKFDFNLQFNSINYYNN